MRDLDSDLRAYFSWLDEETRPATDAAVRARTGLTRPDTSPNAGTRRWRRTAAITSAVAVVVIGALVVSELGEDSDRDQGLVVGEEDASGLDAPTGGLFAVETGLTLLIDDGSDGLLALDLDRGLARNHSFEDKPPGDHPVRLARVGNRVIWPGRPDTWSVPASLDEPASVFGDGFVIVPTGDGETVWLEADAEGDSHQFGPPLEATLLDSDGQIIEPTTALPVFEAPNGQSAPTSAERGTRDGLWLELSWPHGVAEPGENRLWTPAEGLTDWSVESPCLAFGAGSYLALPDPATACREVTIAASNGSAETRISPPEISNVVFSDDQNRVAFVGRNSIVVYDVATGDEIASTSEWLTTAPHSVAWSPDGHWLVVTDWDARPEPGSTRIGVFDVEADTFHEASAQIGMTMHFVVVDANDGPQLDSADPVDPCTVADRQTGWSNQPTIPDESCQVEAAAPPAGPIGDNPTEPPRLLIFNSSPICGADGALQQRIDPADFSSVEIADSEYSENESWIEYAPGYKQHADALQAELGIPVQDWTFWLDAHDEDLVISLGNDANNYVSDVPCDNLEDQ